MTMRVLVFLLLLSLSASATPAVQYLPPPAAPFALAGLTPIDHSRKILVQPPPSNYSIVVYLAPYSPLLAWVSQNVSVTIIRRERGMTREINGSSSRIYLLNETIPGTLLTIRVSIRNSSVVFYIMTPSEEQELLQNLSPPHLDPRRVKRVRAVTAALVAVLAGVPLGYRIKRKVVERKAKRVPWEEL